MNDDLKAAVSSQHANQARNTGAGSLIGHFPYVPTPEEKAEQEKHMKRHMRASAVETACRLCPPDAEALISAAKVITAYIEGAE